MAVIGISEGLLDRSGAMGLNLSFNRSKGSKDTIAVFRTKEEEIVMIKHLCVFNSS